MGHPVEVCHNIMMNRCTNNWFWNYGIVDKVIYLWGDTSVENISLFESFRI